MLEFDAIIIGAGQSGVPLSLKLASEGIKTAIIEKRVLGGTCVNDGCTPTKTLIACAENAYRISHSEECGIHVPSFSIDFDQIMYRKNQLVLQSRSHILNSIEEAENLTFFRGEACFTDAKEIQVKLQGRIETLRSNYFFIDAGLRPDIPQLEGLNQTPFFTSTTILDITECPENLIIIGGNYVGLEMAQLFSRLGSKVTVIEKNKQILPKEDADIAERLQGILEAEGVRIYAGAAVQSVKGTSPVLTFRTDGKEQHVSGTHLLLATGRVPQTDALALDKAGVEVDEKGFIKVNKFLETTASGIYAMGDIKGGPAFTHISYNDYLVVYDHFVKGLFHKYYERQIPYCMFTNPQLGRVGITETKAREEGQDIKVFTLDMENSARGKETGNTNGMMKAVVDKKTDEILGVSILSAQGGEVMSVLQMAMAGRMTASQLKEQVFAHPLYSESINNLFS